MEWQRELNRNCVMPRDWIYNTPRTAAEKQRTATLESTDRTGKYRNRDERQITCQIGRFDTKWWNFWSAKARKMPKKAAPKKIPRRLGARKRWFGRDWTEQPRYCLCLRRPTHKAGGPMGEHRHAFLQTPPSRTVQNGALFGRTLINLFYVRPARTGLKL